MNRITLGAIDIGSNAMRLLIDYVEHYEDTRIEFKKAAYVRVPIRLGEDVFTSGRIGETKSRKLGEAIYAFERLMRVYEVQAMRACATSAMREASNSATVIEHIRRQSGITVEIISGDEEADTIYAAGGLCGLDRDKTYVYMDVGGGSTEIVVYSGHSKREACSFPLGTVRMIEGAEPKGEIDNFRRHLERIGALYAPKAIIGSGGNINKVHKMLDKKARESVKLAEMEELYKRLEQLDYRERMERFALNAYRADVIVPALRLFITAARAASVNRVVVPKVGLVDGIIHRLHAQLPRR